MSRYWRTFSSLALAITMVIFSASLASAHSGKGLTHHLSRHLYHHNTQYAPHQASNYDLVYNGGPVMAGTSQTYAIFWEPSGSTVSTNYNSLILRYLSDVGSSPLYHNNIQYTDSQGNAPTGSTLGGSWVDTQTPYPGQTIGDNDIQQEIIHAMQVNGWTPSLQHLFIVFTASNVSNWSGTAYHYSFTDSSGNNVVYATVPDTFASWHVFPGNTSPNNDFDADSTILVTSHEQTEAATDPLPPSGWIDNNGQEIGDKCEHYFGQQNADGSNVNWNGHPYIVQDE